MKKIEIVYHIAVMGGYYNIVKEQLDLLRETGLMDACSQLTVSIVGKFNRELYSLLSTNPYYKKMRVSSTPYLQECEFPSIRAVQRIAAENPGAQILYMHTKGASHGVATSVNSRWTPTQVKNLVQWRKFLEYHTINKWRDCVKYLDSYDACGTDWGSVNGRTDFHFSGNFWWANATYINRCRLGQGDRFVCETFIGTGNPKVKVLQSSIDNPRIKEYHRDWEINNMRIQFPGGLTFFNWYDYYYKNEWFVDGYGFHRGWKKGGR
ncbi:MAG: hypothetical protein FWF59_10730 [Turicibacter sp.]|nr:hypothetical protein [Turicibacter sp.]